MGGVLAASSSALPRTRAYGRPLPGGQALQINQLGTAASGRKRAETAPIAKGRLLSFTRGVSTYPLHCRGNGACEWRGIG
jgi:hypothetical protein